MEKVFSLFSITRLLIAKIIWGPPILGTEKILALHRQQTEKKIIESNLTPSRLKQIIQQGILLLEQAYNEAHSWFNTYKTESITALNPYNINFLIKYDSPYRCVKFITPLGEFNDVEWAKQFVNDSNNIDFDRFHLACFYCFETEINNLWQQLSSNKNYRYIYNKDYKSIRRTRPELVSFWIHYLDGKLEEWIEGPHTPRYFFFALRKAIRSGHRNAVCYFLEKLPLAERMALQVNSDKYAKLVYSAAMYKHAKIMHFLYSTLTLEQQHRVLQYDIQENQWSAIWECYLQPAFISLIPAQIKQHHNMLPATAYSQVLYSLACKIEELKNSLYQKIFQDVWRLGSAEVKKHFLENNVFILEILLCAKEFTCTKLLLRDLSFDKKRDFLLTIVSKIIFYQFLDENDWSAVQKYLKLFMIDLCQENTSSNLKPFHMESLSLLKELREEILLPYFSITSKETKLAVITLIESLIQEIEINFLVKELLLETKKKITDIALSQATSSFSIKDEQQASLSAMTASKFFSNATTRKYAYTDKYNVSTSPTNNSSVNIEGELIESPRKKIKVSAIL